MKRSRDRVDIREPNAGFQMLFHLQVEYLAEHLDAIGPAGVWLYIVLRRFANYDTATVEITSARIVEMAKMSRASVFRYLAILEDHKLIRRLPKVGGGLLIHIFPGVPKHFVRKTDFPLFDGEEAAKPQGLTGEMGPNGLDGSNDAVRDGTVSPVGRDSLIGERVIRKEELDVEVNLNPAIEPSTHSIVRTRINELYSQFNPGHEAPWDGRTGKVLKETIDKLKFSAESLLTCVDNRFASEVVLCEDPREWIPRLALYLRGPVNQFNRPLNGNGKGKNGNATQASRERLQRELDISDSL